MSNYLAVATVTTVLRNLLQGVITTAVPGAEVTLKRPEKAAAGVQDEPSVNLYLYQVSPNPAWRNADLPTRNSAGQAARRPQIALDLHYLLTFYGDEAKMEPQRLLGKVVSALHAQPALAPAYIEQVLSAAATTDFPGDDFLAESDLAQQVERIRFTPLSLSLEELSKIWSIFFQVPYALTVAYQASVVLIESDEVDAEPAPVVEKQKIMVEPEVPTL